MLLEVDKLEKGIEYNLKINSVKDMANNPNTPITTELVLTTKG